MPVPDRNTFESAYSGQAPWDIGLPSIDGHEVARRIRAHTAKPVLIAMTGYGQPEDRQKSKEAGFDYHLTKPVDPDRLQDLLGKISSKS